MVTRTITVFIAVLGLAISSSAAQAQTVPGGEARLAEARQRIATTEEFFAAGNYEGALAESLRAYDLLEGLPNRYVVLFNIGQCYERMFRYDRALEYYRRYLEEGGPDAEDRATVEATMRALDAMLGTLHLTSNVTSAELWIDDLQIGPFDAQHTSVRLPAGRHTIALRADGFVPAQAEVQVVVRAAGSLELTLERLSVAHGLSPVLFWTSAGLSVVSVGVGIAFGAIAMSQSADANANAADPYLRLTENTPALKAEIERNALIADVLYGVGALFGVTSVVLAFLTEWGGEADRTAAAASVGLRVVPVGGSTFAGIAMDGHF